MRCRPRQWLVPFLAMSLGGCLLPYPHRTCRAEGIHGQVVDSRTGKGVPDAEVTLLSRPHVENTIATSSSGRFGVEGAYLQQWAILIGPTILSLPHAGAYLKTPHPVVTRITHPLYRTWKPGAAGQPDAEDSSNLYQLSPK